MAAVASVTATPVPPSPVGGTAPVSASSAGAAAPSRSAPPYDPAAVAAASAAIRESPGSIGLGFVGGRLSLVVLPEPASGAQSAPAASSAVPTGQTAEAQIQAALSDVIFQLDDLPEKHPNSPAVAILLDERTQLQQALAEAQIGSGGPAQTALSGIVLNATV